MTEENTGLRKHAGCEGCHKQCQYNSPVATKEKAEETSGRPFNCNSSLFKNIGELIKHVQDNT
jgi:hypothetical protein